MFYAVVVILLVLFALGALVWMLGYDAGFRRGWNSRDVDTRVRRTLDKM